MTRDIKKYWEFASENYQKTADIKISSAHYGPYAPNENKLKLLGDIKNKKVLEIGCGGAQNSIVFAKKGAICTAIDISEQQLNYAKQLAEKEKVNIRFIQKDIQNLKGIKSNQFDIVFSAFALQYIPNLKKTFKEVNRVLKNKGIFVFSFDHPFYSMLSTETLKLIYNYNTKKVFEENIKDKNKKIHKFIAYHRKVSDIYNSLVDSGFVINKILEPFDKTTEKAWKKNYWKDVYPLKLVKMIPPTIIFKTRKK